MIAFVKDIMIYVFVIAAMVIIPDEARRLWRDLRCRGARLMPRKPRPRRQDRCRPAAVAQADRPLHHPGDRLGLALFMYPHSLTGTLSASQRQCDPHQCHRLPAYSLVLGLIALMGYMALAAGVKVTNPQDAVPQSF